MDGEVTVELVAMCRRYYVNTDIVSTLVYPRARVQPTTSLSTTTLLTRRLNSLLNGENR